MTRTITTLALATLLVGCDDPKPEPAESTEPAVVDTTFVVDTTEDAEEQWYHCENVCTAAGSRMVCEETCVPISRPPEVE